MAKRRLRKQYIQVFRTFLSPSRPKYPSYIIQKHTQKKLIKLNGMVSMIFPNVILQNLLNRESFSASGATTSIVTL